MAQEGRLQVFKHLGTLRVAVLEHCIGVLCSKLPTLTGGLSLEALYSPLRGQSALKIEKCGEVPGGSAHSAGYDARVTAEVFLLELDIWMRFQKRKKQEKQAAAAESGQNAENAENAGHEPDAQGAQDGGESRESEQDVEGASKETASHEIATEVATEVQQAGLGSSRSVGRRSGTAAPGKLKNKIDKCCAI